MPWRKSTPPGSPARSNTPAFPTSRVERNRRSQRGGGSAVARRRSDRPARRSQLHAKANALFYEFEEIGLNKTLGYETPADIVYKYPAVLLEQRRAADLDRDPLSQRHLQRPAMDRQSLQQRVPRRTRADALGPADLGHRRKPRRLFCPTESRSPRKNISLSESQNL